MSSRATIKWVGLALLGLLVAAGVAIAASNLASQQIGLASEPISAGDALAPAASPNSGHGSQSPGRRPRRQQDPDRPHDDPGTATYGPNPHA